MSHERAASFAVCQAALRLREFTVQDIVDFSGVGEDCAKQTLSLTLGMHVISFTRRDGDGDDVYEIADKQIEAFRHFADQFFTPGGPGVGYQVATCLLRERRLTAASAAALVGTTRRRAAWELGKLLARGLAECTERDDELEVVVSGDQQRLIALVEHKLHAELPEASLDFPWIDSAWYWAALGIVRRGNASHLDLARASRFMERARKDIPRDAAVAKAWAAALDLLQAEKCLVGAQTTNGIECGQIARDMFAELGMDARVQEADVVLKKLEALAGTPAPKPKTPVQRPRKRSKVRGISFAIREMREYCKV